MDVPHAALNNALHEFVDFFKLLMYVPSAQGSYKVL